MAQAKIPDFSRIFAGILFSLVLAQCLSAAQSSKQRESAIIRYYLENARLKAEVSDLEHYPAGFAVAVLVKRFTFRSASDTLKLDTAILKLWYSPVVQGLPHLDSHKVIISSFLDEKPKPPRIFYDAVWDGAYLYNLFPNDPGSGPMAIGCVTPLDSMESRRASGILLLDRTSYEPRNLIIHEQRVLDGTVLEESREVEYGILNGRSLPVTITIRSEVGRLWGREFQSTEIRILKLELH